MHTPNRHRPIPLAVLALLAYPPKGEQTHGLYALHGPLALNAPVLKVTRLDAETLPLIDPQRAGVLLAGTTSSENSRDGGGRDFGLLATFDGALWYRRGAAWSRLDPDAEIDSVLPDNILKDERVKAILALGDTRE